MEKQLEKANGLSSGTLKIIAAVTMIIDHFGFAVYCHLPDYQYDVYQILRYIGRVSFPIYCFLLVEGFHHTKNVKKYISRLFLFALISEIPFDMAFHRQIIHPQTQNVFFTLTIGLIAVSIVDRYRKLSIRIITIIITMSLGGLLKVDYGAFGIFLILLIYFAQNHSKNLMEILGAVAVVESITAPLSFLIIHFYNGRRGIRLKYIFYMIYPVHLLIFAIIRMVLKI